MTVLIEYVQLENDNRVAKSTQRGSFHVIITDKSQGTIALLAMKYMRNYVRLRFSALLGYQSGVTFQPSQTRALRTLFFGGLLSPPPKTHPSHPLRLCCCDVAGKDDGMPGRGKTFGI